MSTADAQKKIYAKWASERVNGEVVHGSSEDSFGATGRLCPECQAEQDLAFCTFWAIWERENNYTEPERTETKTLSSKAWRSVYDNWQPVPGFVDVWGDI